MSRTFSNAVWAAVTVPHMAGPAVVRGWPRQTASTEGQAKRLLRRDCDCERYGATATANGSRIKGCTMVAAGDVGRGGRSTAATYMLKSRTATINSRSTAEARDGVDAVLRANKTEAYFAPGQRGRGWTVTTSNDPDLQLQTTFDAGALVVKLSRVRQRHRQAFQG